MESIPPVDYRRDPYRLSTDATQLDLDVIHAYLARESYWAKGLDRAVMERSIRHSLNFGMYQGTAQVGFARVVTDYATYAYLNDVFVLPAHQGQGLGKWLIECVVAHPDLQTLLRFGLATRDAQGLYQQYGFTALVYPERHMERLPEGYYKQGP